MQDSITQSQISRHQSMLLAQAFQDPSLDARRVSVAAGDVIFEAEDTPQTVYFIHSGQVRLYQVAPHGEERLVEILGPGDWFGMAALAGMNRSNVRAVAAVSSIISQMPAEKLLAALKQRPEALVELNRQLTHKLQAARDEASSLIFQDCNDRLIQTLLRFSDSAAAAPQENGIVLRITHQQLAQAVGVARETVSLALTQLRLRNVLRTGRNQLFFDPQVLKDLKKNGHNGHRAPVEQKVA